MRLQQENDFSIWRQVEASWRRNSALRPIRKAFRATKRFLPNQWRLATHRYRQLPAAVIVGAQKAGTTQLHLCLTRHPRCFSGATKELHYFTKRSDYPLSWYRSQFPFARTVARVGGVCLESTPSYLPSPTALRMMSQVLPDARIIALLRDPVSRAFSHYQHYKTRHLETRKFRDIVDEAINRPASAPTRGAALRDDAKPMLDYVSRGYYAQQLELLLAIYPRQQVLIIDSADLFDDTNGVCQKVFEFLGVGPHPVPPRKIHNRGYYREKIDPTVADLLRDHYRPHDQLLVELLDRRFCWMGEEDESAHLQPAAA
jgi:Sulfotransferase domain